MGWVTSIELASYLGVDEAALPENPATITRLIERATEFLDVVTRGRYDPTDATVPALVTERVKRATCAQVAMWLDSGALDSAEQVGNIESYSAGSVSIKYAAGGSTSNGRIAPRARDALFMSGLLYAGVRQRSGYAGDDL